MERNRIVEENFWANRFADFVDVEERDGRVVPVDVEKETAAFLQFNPEQIHDHLESNPISEIRLKTMVSTINEAIESGLFLHDKALNDEINDRMLRLEAYLRLHED